MRVLHVIPSVSDHRGGPSFMVKAMAEGLAGLGLDVHVAATDDDGAGHLDVPLEQPVPDNGVMYWYFRRQTQFYKMSWPMTRWLGRHVGDYDLLHLHALFSYPALPAAFFAARQDIPYIVRPLGTLNPWGMEQRRPWLKQISYRLIEKRILGGATRIHYTCEQEQIEAEKLGVHSPGAVVPLGVDGSEFSDQATTDWLQQHAPHLAGRTIVLFLSRLDMKKGLDVLLPAFAQLRERRPDVGLVIAGSGQPAFEAELRQTACELDIEDHVYWAGFLADNAKLSALTEADLFVLPSYSENFGSAVVEAMACGLPVIVSDRVGIHREIGHGRAGLIVSCNVESLTSALCRLVEESRLRREMGANGRRLAQERFTLQALTRSLKHLYEEIV